MPDRFRGTFDRKKGDLVTKSAPDGYEYVPGWGHADRLPTGNENQSIDLYDDEVFYTDYSIGLVREKLEALGLLDETVLIVTSDHGEDLDLHGLWGHGTVHNTTIFVPTIIRDPKHLPQGERVAGFVQHADHLPTVLEYFPEQSRPEFGRAALTDWMPEIPQKFDGDSLLAVALGQRTAKEEIVVESGQHRAYIAPPWKLIWHKDGRKSELFHLENDPLELHNRAEEEKAVTAEVSEKLRDWVDRNLAGERTDPIFGSNGAWTCYIGKKGERGR